MMAFAFRAANIADARAMWKLETRVFGEDAWSEATVREELAADHRSYLAMVDARGSVCGYGGLRVVAGEADIQTIAIAPEARGKGFGRRLMAALLEQARDAGARTVFLEVRADNDVAQALYRSLGFEVIDVRQRYYQPGDIDALVMRAEMEDTDVGA